uniref:Uncharacterized protein n=1 Tax=Romanomermis culicivorax TaxID=13658 RepID=A0A915JPS7_ROMCU
MVKKVSDKKFLAGNNLNTCFGISQLGEDVTLYPTVHYQQETMLYIQIINISLGADRGHLENPVTPERLRRVCVSRAVQFRKRRVNFKF